MDTIEVFGKYNPGPAAGLERGERRREIVRDGSRASTNSLGWW